MIGMEHVSLSMTAAKFSGTIALTAFNKQLIQQHGGYTKIKHQKKRDNNSSLISKDHSSLPLDSKLFPNRQIILQGAE